MPHVFAILAAASLCAWLYLVLARGGFWRAGQHLPTRIGPPSEWPAVVAVVPARDEVDVIGDSVGSLLDQDYPGPFAIVLVDDASRDGTAERARAVARAHPAGDRLRVVAAPPLRPGWMGKMGAVAAGVDEVGDGDDAPRYLWLTDADVAHDAGSLRRLVAHAEAERLDLVSLMVLLEHRGWWAGLLIPAFVYFFQLLYPFPWVNRGRVDAAAGGSMLVRRASLAATGGIARIRGAVIDDCALARLLRRADGSGRLWLGRATGDRSIRPYAGLGGVWRMVRRSAYTQLRHSPFLLLGTVVALTLVYGVPPVVVASLPWHRDALAAGLAALAWLLMAATFVPTLRQYRRPGLIAFALPLASALYLGMTLDSAWRHSLGRGPRWKGRAVRDGVRVAKDGA